MAFYYSRHIELWNFLCNNPELDKQDWVKWRINGGTYEEVIHSCFACDYVVKNDPISKLLEQRGLLDCDLCPFGYFGTYKNCLGGLYEEWRSETDLNKKAMLAAKIRDLPVKEGVICK